MAKVIPLIPETVKDKVLQGLEDKRLSVRAVMEELEKQGYNTKLFTKKQQTEIVHKLL